VKKIFKLNIILLFTIIPGFIMAQSSISRPPAIPLINSDPYFSIWSFADNPADDYTRHWTGSTMSIFSMVKIDNKTYRVLGNNIGSIPKLNLRQTIVNGTQTIFIYSDAGIELKLLFTTPLLPDSLDLISEDASYITWQVKSIDGSQHDISVYIDNCAELCLNTSNQKVTWGRLNLDKGIAMKMGSVEQPVLEKSGDDLRIDWGYVYLVSPKNENPRSAIASADEVRNDFIENNVLPDEDNFNMPRQGNDSWPVQAFAFDLGKVGAETKEVYSILAYDDIYSIEYFHRKLAPYWKRNGKSINDIIDARIENYNSLMNKCENFDKDLLSTVNAKGGEDYASICALAYRQVFAAHKLAVDINGTPMLFPKEDFSNGCISTVDVIYPSAPFFLYFNPELLKALLTPVFEYSSMPRWKFPFAPHDVGTYPKANGQVYGGGEKSEENQMPVEESGNMIILTYGICRADNNTSYAEKYWSSLEKWAEYLKEKGLDPENQLCTDDFTGHLAHNTNLSVKAIVALDCYSKICEMTGKIDKAEEYHNLAKGYAKKWEEMAFDNDHYKLAFDKPGTWSMKYNLVWDKLFKLNLFPEKVFEKELQFYKTKLNKYGLPLDNRADFTKPEWMTWITSMYTNKKDFDDYMHTITKYLNDTPDRIPFNDWYETKTARKDAFQARSVVGGIFIKLLFK
jgi:Glutaminase A six helical-hairpin domain/Domain of unknown function (DUF5127)/Domain of unknown function (DUF4964)